MTETRVEVCDKCGAVFDPTACFSNGHDLMPCPVCYAVWDIGNKVRSEQYDKIDIRNRVNSWLNDINELKEQIKDLQAAIDDIAEELDA